MNNKTLYVMLPCYNEELNIGILIDEWMEQKEKLSEAGYNLHVCAIDDCSTDNTKNVILEKSGQYPDNVELLTHEVNKNLRGGLNTSIEYFLNNGKDEDLMCLMDGDATHSPKYIHNMIKKHEDNKIDCVIASRYCKDSNVVGLASHRKFLSDMAKIYYSVILRVPNVRDYTCGYRVYNKKCIKRLVKRFGKDPIQEQSFACMMEFLYKIYLTGAKFGEVGFELRYDKKQGESKMNINSTVKKSLITALKLRRMRKKEFKKK